MCIIEAGTKQYVIHQCYDLKYLYNFGSLYSNLISVARREMPQRTSLLLSKGLANPSRVPQTQRKGT